MSKITNTILMIKLLSNGRVYSVKELSDELGVTERMVRYYKEQLEMAGYIIESFKGPGGGYYINKNDMININYFNKYDLEVLDKVQSEISTSGNDKLIKGFIELNKKLHSIYNTNKVLSEYKDINVVVNSLALSFIFIFLPPKNIVLPIQEILSLFNLIQGNILSIIYFFYI